MKLYRTNVGILPCPVGYHCIVFFPVSKSPISSFSSWLGNGRVSRVWGNPEKFSAGRLGLSRMSMSSKDPQIPSPSGAKELRSVGSRPPASQAHLPVLYCFPGRNHTFLFKGRR